MNREQEVKGVPEYQKKIWAGEISRQAEFSRALGLKNLYGLSIDLQESLSPGHPLYRDSNRPPKKRLGYPDRPHGRHFRPFIR